MSKTISGEQVKFFDDNGYLVYRGLVAGDELKQMTDECQAFIDNKRETFFRDDLGGDDETPVGKENFLQILGLWKTSPMMREIALSEERGRIAGALLHTKSVQLLSDMILSKPGQLSRPTHWHQDYVDHSTSIPEVTMWISLDVATEESGCMRYLPGSHKLGEKVGYDYDAGQNYEKVGMDISTAVMVEAEPGDAIFHLGLTLHGAGPNQTEQQRRAYIIRYAAGETVFRWNEPIYGPKEENVIGKHLDEEDHPFIVRDA